VPSALRYHISLDDANKHSFSFTDCLTIVMRGIFSAEGKLPSVELLALGINLAANQKNAEIICQHDGLKMLIKKALSGEGDPVLLKMVRNISLHDGRFTPPGRGFLFCLRLCGKPAALVRAWPLRVLVRDSI